MQHWQPKGNTEKLRAEISRADEERSSLGGLNCTFMVVRNTVSGRLPKRSGAHARARDFA